MSPGSQMKPVAGTAAALLLVAGSGLLAGCSSATSDDATRGDTQAVAAQAAEHGDAQPPVQTTETDWKPVADALGRTGTLMNGTVYRIPLPRKDLTVTTQGVTVKPGLALGGYATFAKYHDGTMLMGDLVVTEDELPQVTDALQAAGIEQTALHKHLLQQSPAIWWTHIHAMGDPAALAKGLESALAATAVPPASPPPATQRLSTWILPQSTRRSAARAPPTAASTSSPSRARTPSPTASTCCRPRSASPPASTSSPSETRRLPSTATSS